LTWRGGWNRKGATNLTDWGTDYWRASGEFVAEKEGGGDCREKTGDGGSEKEHSRIVEIQSVI